MGVSNYCYYLSFIISVTNDILIRDGKNYIYLCEYIYKYKIYKKCINKNGKSGEVLKLVKVVKIYPYLSNFIPYGAFSV